MFQNLNSTSNSRQLDLFWSNRVGLNWEFRWASQVGKFKLTSNWTQLSNGYDTAALCLILALWSKLAYSSILFFFGPCFVPVPNPAGIFFSFFFLPDLFVSFDAETTLDPLLVAESDWDLGTNYQVLSFLVLLRGWLFVPFTTHKANVT